MQRRFVLTGLAGIFASGIAPAVISSGILMPCKKIIIPTRVDPGIYVETPALSGKYPDLDFQRRFEKIIKRYNEYVKNLPT